MEPGFYELPKLKFGYDALVPFMSEEQLKLHHTKHHQAYVDNSNNILKKVDAANKEGSELDMKSLLKELSFNVGGHTLHSYFWENLAPPGRGGDKPGGALADAIARDFGSIERFRKMFSQAANSVEGSGWAVLSYSAEVKRLTIMQLEKHNVNVFPTYPILMLLDLWEHAYYVDYKNARAKFTEAFWSIVNWEAAGRWFEKLV